MIADQLAGPAARLEHEPHARPRAGGEVDIADVAAEAVRAEVGAGRHRIAGEQPARARLDQRDRGEDRDLAAQPAQQAIGRAHVADRRVRHALVGPRRAGELDRAPRVLQRGVERRAHRADQREVAAHDLALEILLRPGDREHADHDRGRERGEREDRDHARPQRTHPAHRRPAAVQRSVPRSSYQGSRVIAPASPTPAAPPRSPPPPSHRRRPPRRPPA